MTFDGSTVEHILTVLGAVSAAGLVTALAGGHVLPALRIWPAPPQRSVRSFAYWTLFRTLNVAVIALALLKITAEPAALFEPPARIAALALSMLTFAVYLYALWVLGREATYCQASGLETGGIYQWSRNPQYATAILAYAILGAGLGDAIVAALAAAMIAVYALMALAEEPWLRTRYGAAYEEYAQRVPRFFNWRRLGAAIIAAASPFRADAAKTKTQ